MTSETEVAEIKETDSIEISDDLNSKGSDEPIRKASTTYRLREFKSFSDTVTKMSGEIINNCYQCKKCSNGCPVTYAMDIQPHKIIKMIQLGLEKEVLTSKTIWLCAACETCGTRCPNEIKLADMMDALRQLAEKSKYRLGERKASVFHSAFIDSIRRYGRVYELGMIRKFLLKSGGLFSKLFDGTLITDGKLGIKLFKRGKLGLTPEGIKNRSEVRDILKDTR